MKRLPSIVFALLLLWAPTALAEPVSPAEWLMYEVTVTSLQTGISGPAEEIDPITFLMKIDLSYPAYAYVTGSEGDYRAFGYWNQPALETAVPLASRPLDGMHTAGEAWTEKTLDANTNLTHARWYNRGGMSDSEGYTRAWMYLDRNIYGQLTPDDFESEPTFDEYVDLMRHGILDFRFEFYEEDRNGQVTTDYSIYRGTAVEVPEPSTLLLMGLGAAAFTLRRMGSRFVRAND